MLEPEVLTEVWCLKSRIERWWYSTPKVQTCLYCILAIVKFLCVPSRKEQGFPYLVLIG